MHDISRAYRRQTQLLLFALALFVVGWGFSELQEFFLGLKLGTVLGMFNHWLLARKIKQFGTAIVQGRSVKSLGTASRFATAIFATLLAIEFEQFLHLHAVVIGLMTPYLVIMIDAFLQTILRKTQEER
ncbi:ATP synthase subunit I [Aureibacillus halotolerans]|uniref:ATP synthase protein I n=1 Tax=Aureibacillus halotolerans TaxID=1508390 RepID=A0A4R6U2W8_9BACI|nr:ATP synthase subunit I [Aureibacillus halotolerans]TDQ38735.1 ATP synthase protein I [Aureibacillus halotolerans]